MAAARIAPSLILPPAADGEAASRLVERFAALGPAEARAAGTAPMRALLAALGGNSPYLSDLALREPATLRAVLSRGPDAVRDAALAEVASLSPTLRREPLALALRAAKRRVALATAIADLGGVWTLEQVTGALADLAETALDAALGHLLLAAHEEGALHLPHPDRPLRDCGFTILGMGKLGARELNYSSDIDLVLLYDPDAHADHADELRTVFSRVARGLVALMEGREFGGFVFRTDLRLRPDPAATPPAIALPAAIAYYESMGQNWERAAMIKARPVAGDRALGARFLEAIRPFVWRRHLDFAAIADIHAMKRRIDQHRGVTLDPDVPPAARVLGHNVKLGEGGIREIEFVCQTLELVWGGRNPTLREKRTLPALALLAREGLIEAAAATELGDSYRHLRAVEHRLQMVADRQTHALPASAAELDRFAVFMNEADGDAFARRLLFHLDRVHRRYRDLFETETAEGDPLDVSGRDDPPAATRARLLDMGFGDADRVVATVRGWHAGRVRALRSERARALLRRMLPRILEALGAARDPDAALARFDMLLARLPAGVQLLSLFQRNPAALDRVATVLGAAAPLADHLAATPSALEGLLRPAEAAPDAPDAPLATELRDARTLEEAIDITRRFVRGEEFRLSVATIERRIDADAAGAARTALADAAIGALLPRVMRDYAATNGRVAGGGMVVVALGKAGSREMMAGSDLDLMLIYDHPDTSADPAGRRRMAASQYYIRAAHRFVAALTAPGAEGPLYAVDMRLRPSGNKGPVAVSLAGFARYHAGEAWTWERMALTRARVVAGPAALRRRVARAIAAALDEADPALVAADACAMRRRMASELPAPAAWDLKQRAGGLIDVEFIAQALMLIHGGTHPAIRHPTPRIALARMAARGLLADADAALLIRADRVYRSVLGALRVLVGRLPEAERLPPAVEEVIGRAIAAPQPASGSTLGAASGAAPLDGAAIAATIETLTREVRATFARLLGDPDAPPAPAPAPDPLLKPRRFPDERRSRRARA